VVLTSKLSRQKKSFMGSGKSTKEKSLWVGGTSPASSSEDWQKGICKIMVDRGVTGEKSFWRFNRPETPQRPKNPKCDAAC